MSRAGQYDGTCCRGRALLIAGVGVAVIAGSAMAGSTATTIMVEQRPVGASQSSRSVPRTTSHERTSESVGVRRDDIDGRPDQAQMQPAPDEITEVAPSRVASPVSAFVWTAHVAGLVLAIVMAKSWSAGRQRSVAAPLRCPGVVQVAPKRLVRRGMAIAAVASAAAVVSGIGIMFPVEFRWLSGVAEFGRDVGLFDGPAPKLLDEVWLNHVLHRFASLLALLSVGMTFLIARRDGGVPFARLGSKGEAATTAAAAVSNSGHAG